MPAFPVGSRNQHKKNVKGSRGEYFYKGTGSASRFGTTTFTGGSSDPFNLPSVKKVKFTSLMPAQSHETVEEFDSNLVATFTPSSINTPFSPHNTTVQPQYHDTAGGFYGHYVVTASRMSVQIVPNNSWNTQANNGVYLWWTLSTNSAVADDGMNDAAWTVHDMKNQDNEHPVFYKYLPPLSGTGSGNRIETPVYTINTPWMAHWKALGFAKSDEMLADVDLGEGVGAAFGFSPSTNLFWRFGLISFDGATPSTGIWDFSFEAKIDQSVLLFNKVDVGVSVA